MAAEDKGAEMVMVSTGASLSQEEEKKLIEEEIKSGADGVIVQLSLIHILEKEHKAAVAKLSDHQEIKDENYVYKNRLFDAKMTMEKEFQAAKDRSCLLYTS